MAQTYTPLATNTVSGSSTSAVSFTSIPQTYTDLVIVANTSNSVSLESLALTFNGDTGTNYSNTRLYGNGTSAISDRATSAAYIAALLNSNTIGNSIIHIMNYANTTTYKTTISRTGDASNRTSAVVGLWRGSTGSATQAITSITITVTGSNYVSGSTFSLYGIKAA